MSSSEQKNRAILPRIGLFLVGAASFVLGVASGRSFDGAGCVGIGASLMALAIFRSAKVMPYALVAGIVALYTTPYFTSLIGR